jgi:hypothetical protein
MHLGAHKTMNRAWTALGLTLTLIAGHAVAQTGSSDDPIQVHMKRGTDAVTFTGRMRQNHDCCAYAFKAHAGQTLNWRETGAVVRTTMTYPDGHTDGPGLPNAIPLPADGAYVFTISPDTMADGAFGRFVLKLKIPPAPHH